MAQTMHTPGPWVLSPNGMRVRHKSPSGLPICLIEYGEERKANAALIAAAPDLLASLVALLEQDRVKASAIESGPNSILNDVLREARAAIAKATNIQQ